MAYEYLGWATNDTDGSGEVTKSPPPIEVMQTGLQRGEPMGRQWFNYLFNYLLSREAGGKTSTPTNAVRIFGKEQPDMLNNGWVLVKTEVLAAASGGNLYYYEHTGV